MNHPHHVMRVGILVLGLAILTPGPVRHAAPLPVPKKMAVPPEAERYIGNLKQSVDRQVVDLSRRKHEALQPKNALFEYYDNSIQCLRGVLAEDPPWKLDRPLTTEERRGLRDLLYRLQREMAEGQANGTVGHESLSQAWRRHREAQKKKK